MEEEEERKNRDSFTYILVESENVAAKTVTYKNSVFDLTQLCCCK